MDLSIKRTAHLARWNLVLLTRNRLAFVYAVVMPLLPLLLLLTGDRGSETAGASAITTLFLVAGLFPVYYNVLAQFVNRRDELVLKRMRTGEVRDSELVASIALPGIASALGVSLVAIPVAVAFGQELPVNVLLYVAGAVFTVVMLSAFAFWTAAWTKSAESAQLTSLPIILIVSFGPLFTSISGLPDVLRDLAEFTPGSAMSEMVRIGWFGLDGPDATKTTLDFAETWSVAAEPLLVIVAWTFVAISLAKRSMRWEPRS
ncbi:ABC transporter permease [Solirubrobacter phytolaccae]|uniref:ABC transporter permease n=1 Tax=Solirubrobacter phytolaccae TaxID=1404360 RepID=A0A9X3SC82_9ACTN|nr:ABC transporter permease [Solirubrobacter phytolaccae]MDA0185538.1 ABC transporter permease [Solirubrobacter phytolaccae]